MSRLKDLTEKKFGRLTVLKRAEGNTKDHRALWLCRCSCGNEIITSSHNLLSGDCKSCGCLHRDRAKNLNASHRLSKTRPYNIWCNMKERCYNPKHHHYKWYGDKGITICDEWKNDFKSFYDWALNNGYQDDLTIERIDVNGNYCPENCTWIPLKEQARNRRDNLKYLGLTQSEWDTQLGLYKGALACYRYTHSKCSLEEAVNHYIEGR